jgi:pyruvate formate lyase activating enzyme
MGGRRIRKALLYETVENRVRCLTCERRCLVPGGAVGFCATRRNIGGHIYTLCYGDISSISANPIEKKPLFHFYPGTRALTIGTWSCNFTCPWCQNCDISKTPENIGRGRHVDPEAFVELLARHSCQGTSISLNEPTLLLEYSLDVFDLARESGYYNTYVTNGYMTEQALDMLIAHGLDAVNVDIKGEAEAVRRYCGADVDLVWRNAIRAKERGVWLELTTLVIPGVNDAEDGLHRIARRIKREVGPDVPWHVTGYSPAYKFRSQTYVPPTPVSTLAKARDIGVAEGLKFVYAGNVPGHPYENTYCPGCQRCLIERSGFSTTSYALGPDKRCPQCGMEVPVIGDAVP